MIETAHGGSNDPDIDKREAEHRTETARDSHNPAIKVPVRTKSAEDWIDERRYGSGLSGTTAIDD